LEDGIAGMLPGSAHHVERKRPMDLKFEGAARDPFKIAEDVRTLGDAVAPRHNPAGGP
jgi:hypothetical protein